MINAMDKQPRQTIRTGYAHLTNSARQIGRNTSEMAVKQHTKHQVVGEYFQAKVEDLQERERLEKQEDAQNKILNKIKLALTQQREQENELII